MIATVTTMDPDQNKPNVEHVLGLLRSPEARMRAFALTNLEQAPLADERLLAAAEALLTDETVCLLQIPYLFGEIRYRAAGAVAVLRGVLGKTEPVRLQDVLVPLSADKLGLLAQEVGLKDRKGGIEGQIEDMKRLRAMGSAPRRNLLRTPYVQGVDDDRA